MCGRHGPRAAQFFLAGGGPVHLRHNTEGEGETAELGSWLSEEKLSRERRELAGLPAGSGVLLRLRGESSLNIACSMDAGVQLREDDIPQSVTDGDEREPCNFPGEARTCCLCVLVGHVHGSLRLARVPASSGRPAHTACLEPTHHRALFDRFSQGRAIII